VSKPPTVADLTWLGGLRFSGVSGVTSMTIDGDSAAGPSPVQALAFALAGCMAADVVYILTKGRHPLHALRAHLVAQVLIVADQRLERRVGGSARYSASARSWVAARMSTPKRVRCMSSQRAPSTTGPSAMSTRS
jgi:hypothetical protein